MTNADWVEVYRAKDLVEAQLFCDALIDSGIKAMVDGEWLSNSAGALPLGWSTLPRILCPPEEADRAKMLVYEFESQELGHADVDENWEDQAENMPEA